MSLLSPLSFSAPRRPVGKTDCNNAGARRVTPNVLQPLLATRRTESTSARGAHRGAGLVDLDPRAVEVHSQCMLAHRIFVSMDANVVQLLTSSIAVVGTLAGALLTQMVGRRSERDKRISEDRVRWMNERLRVDSAVMSLAIKLEKQIYDDVALLQDDDSPYDRLPGYLNIRMAPEQGVDGVLEPWVRETLIEDTERMLEMIDEISGYCGEIELLGTPAEARAVNELIDALLGAISHLEAFTRMKDAYVTVLEAKSVREKFARAARLGLAVDVDRNRRKSAGAVTRQSLARGGDEQDVDDGEPDVRIT